MSIFTEVQVTKPNSSTFDLSHHIKQSFKMGALVPTGAIECLPGDIFRIRDENMLRFAPLVSPVMHKIRVRTHHFFVPNRLLWANWSDWITGEADVLHPYVRIAPTSNIAKGTIMDYLGYPAGAAVPDSDAGPKVNPMPVAAYRLIWDEWFRDQNLQEKKFQPLQNGDNSTYYDPFTTDTEPYRRAWRHDYFTSALPFAQKGDEVMVPLVGQDGLEVKFNPSPSAKPKFTKPDGTPHPATDVIEQRTPSGSASSNNQDTAYDPDGTLTVDVQSGATNIETLRKAFKIQAWLEKFARGGSRLTEVIRAHFGVRSSDARLQRPELIGSSSQNMVISEVLATAENDNTGIPVGNMAGHGISVGGSGRMKFRCEEHGWIISLISVIPDTSYQQGLHKSFQRFDRLEYAWPTFAQLGEQEVKNSEVYISHNEPDGTFGYQSRYAEYKHMDDRVAGDMRDNLAFWHLGRIFANEPALNSEFIECRPDTRIFAVTDPTEDHIYAHIIRDMKVNRKLPRFGVPAMR